ncbi:LytR/AlgR family response regulator transcription factor [Bacteroidota bacterium]
MNEKMLVLIIDDEEPARNLVKNFIVDHHELEIIGECADGFCAVKAINESKPDLIFLDIQMPKLNGFELLELIDHKPLIIFTTAFDQYAIKAFEMNATDYLLKPFSKERFSMAVKKAISKSKKNETDEVTVTSLIQLREQEEEFIERIAVRSGSKIHVLAAEDIKYLEADGDYVKIHTADGNFLKEKTMKYFETHLDIKLFVRIHRSYIVNVTEIARLELYDKETHMVFLKKGEKLRASKSGYKLLREVLKL